MDMGIVCVPVIDCYPVERCAEIALGVSHQFAGEGAQILHFAGILGRDDEPKMVPVVFAARGDSFPIVPVGTGVKPLGRRSIAGDALSLRTTPIPADRPRAELPFRVSHDEQVNADGAPDGPDRKNRPLDTNHYCAYRM